MWRKRIGRAIDIAVNAKGAIWAIGATSKIPGGHGIYWYHTGEQKWKTIPGGAMKIAVTPLNHPVIINESGNVFKYQPFVKKWNRLPGSLREIVISAQGKMFAIGTQKVRSGYRILRFENE